MFKAQIEFAPYFYLQVKASILDKDIGNRQALVPQGKPDIEVSPLMHYTASSHVTSLQCHLSFDAFL